MKLLITILVISLSLFQSCCKEKVVYYNIDVAGIEKSWDKHYSQYSNWYEGNSRYWSNFYATNKGVRK
jgi:hypothetical protein